MYRVGIASRFQPPICIKPESRLHQGRGRQDLWLAGRRGIGGVAFDKREPVRRLDETCIADVPEACDNGTSVAASGTLGLQISNANSVGCLGGPFVSGGISAGVGVVVAADDFAGYCQSEGVIGGITTGAGFGGDLSPIVLPVEVHAEATDTTTGVWFNLKDLFNFGRQFFQ